MKIFLIRTFLSFKSAIKILWWFFTRPKTKGAIVLVNNNDDILLIKKSYGRGKWSIPGGNTDKGEEIIETAKREVLEEVGIKIDNLKRIGEYKEYAYFRDHTTYVFSAEAKDRNIKIDPVEISTANWFALKNLPDNLGLSTIKALGFINKRIK